MGLRDIGDIVRKLRSVAASISTVQDVTSSLHYLLDALHILGKRSILNAKNVQAFIERAGPAVVLVAQRVETADQLAALLEELADDLAPIEDEPD